MKDFKKLLIWEKGMDIVVESYNLARLLPVEDWLPKKKKWSNHSLALLTNILEYKCNDIINVQKTASSLQLIANKKNS